MKTIWVVIGAACVVLGTACDGGFRIEAWPPLPEDPTAGTGGGDPSDVGATGSAGGSGEGGAGVATNSPWAPASEQVVTCERHTATPIDAGRALLVGRCFVGDVQVEGALLYDVATRAFTPVPMAQPRTLHAAALLGDGRVAVVGDGAHVEVFDPVTCAFSLGPASLSPRTQPAIAAGPDGRLWVLGGYDEEGGVLASSEVVDLGAATTVPGPTLHEPRAGAGAFALADGSVIVVGGEAPAQCGSSPWPLAIERSNYGMCPFHDVGLNPAGTGGVAIALGRDEIALVTTYASTSWSETTPLEWRDHDATTLFPSVTVTETGRVLAAGLAVYEGMAHVVEVLPGGPARLLGVRPSNGALATITRLVGDIVLVVGPEAVLFTPPADAP